VVESTPPGAQISYREYGVKGAPWRVLGVAPMTNTRLPRTVLEWKAELVGFVTAEDVADQMVAITLAVQGAFVAFFLYLRRRAKRIADLDLDLPHGARDVGLDPGHSAPSSRLRPGQ